MKHKSKVILIFLVLSLLLGAFSTLLGGCTPAQIALSASAITLEKGETYQLTASTLPPNYEKSVKWASENENVAKVSPTGLVTAVSGGVTEIYAYRGEAIAVCKVTVKGAMVDKNGLAYTVTTGNKVAVSASDTFDLETLEIPTTYETYTVTAIAESGFANCLSLKSVTIPAGITVNIYAFSGCLNLETANLPQTLENIPIGMFNNCQKLNTVKMPTSISTIGIGAFSNCWALKDIALSPTITAIGESAFMDCKALTRFSTPQGLTTLPKRLLAGCSSLTALTINSSVRDIGDNAFADCDSLTYVNIPYGVTKIRAGAFMGCDKLVEITMPASLIQIESYMFYDCKSLERVTISAGIRTIGEGVFGGCVKLNTVTINTTTLDTIGAGAFEGCTALKSITLPDAVKTIGDKAFSASGIEQITLGANVTAIGAEAFSKCLSLTLVTMKGGVAPTLTEGTEGKIFEPAVTISVPASALNEYKTKWADYAAQIK